MKFERLALHPGHQINSSLHVRTEMNKSEKRKKQLAVQKENVLAPEKNGIQHQTMEAPEHCSICEKEIFGYPWRPQKIVRGKSEKVCGSTCAKKQDLLRKKEASAASGVDFSEEGYFKHLATKNLHRVNSPPFMGEK